MVSGVVIDLSGRALFPFPFQAVLGGWCKRYIYTDGGVRARSDSDSDSACELWRDGPGPLNAFQDHSCLVSGCAIRSP